MLPTYVNLIVIGLSSILIICIFIHSITNNNNKTNKHDEHTRD